MDYIREELLRQRAVLARLLLGWTAEEAEQEEEKLAEQAEDLRSDDGQMAGLETFLASRALASGERLSHGRRALRTAEEERWEVYDALSENLPEAALRRKLGESEEAYAVRRPEETDRVSRTLYRLGGSETSGRRYAVPGEVRARQARGSLETGAERFAPGDVMDVDVRSAVGETVDARELSRVIQRDARRYDGGFTLY